MDPTNLDLFTVLADVPQSCFAAEDDLEDACASAGADEAGLCRRANGTFAPSMCCAADTIEAALSDRCFEAQITGQTVAGCR